MKKTILALTVPTLLAISTLANAATVYKTDSQSLAVGGRGKFSVNHQDQSNSSFSARLGIKGNTQVTDQLDAFAYIKWDMQSSRDTLNSNTASRQDNIKSRENYVGLDAHQYGRLKLGQDRAPYRKQLTAVTDIFEFDSAQSIAGSYGKEFNSNLAVYNNTFGPVSIYASYQLDTKNGNGGYGNALDTYDAGLVNTFTDQSSAYSFVGIYDTGIGARLHAGLSHQNFAGQGQKDGYGVALTYNLNALYVAARYNYDKEDDGVNTANRQAYAFAAEYRLNDWKLLAGYEYGKQDSDITGNDGHFAKAFNAGATYYFASNVTGMLQWTHDQADGVEHSNIYSAGLKYSF